MLRSEYYRELEESRKLGEMEKAVLRERMSGVESERAQEEGRRLQLESQLEVALADVGKLKDRIAAEVALSEKTANANQDAAKTAREETELLLLNIERLKSEIETTRSALQHMQADVETSVMMFDDILFVVGKKDLAPSQQLRLQAAADTFYVARHITVVGSTDDIEKGKGFELAAARAAAVAGYLRTTLSLPEDKITIISRGIAELRISTDTPAVRARNRRVEVVATFRP